jgi:hypothetical protein
MSLLPVGIGSEVGAGGYQIERSLRFNSADSAYLNKTFSTTPTDRAKKTVSFWVKRSALSSEQHLFSSYNGGGQDGLFFTSGNALAIYAMNGGAGGTVNGVLRDPSAWYHIVYVIDTTQATAGDRLKIWVNGVNFPSGSWTSYSAPSLNSTADILFFQSSEIGRDDFSSSAYLNGYLTEIYYIDGQALTPTSFGEFNTDTGVWQPKAYTGSYGTNGFYLNFSDNSGTTSTTLGKDSSGNGNNWTPNNFSVTAGAGNDSLVDSPTRYGTDTGAGGEVRGNYATWNALVNNSTLTNGNLQIAGKGSSVFYGSVATTGITSGKWYWEITNNSNTDGMTGIIEASQAYAFAGATPAVTTYVGYQSRGYAYHANGNKYNNASSSAYGATYTTNDVIGVAFDADAGTLVFYKNGVSQGTAYTVSAGYTWFPADNVYQSDVKSVNFGQRPFAYTAPSGFKALVTTNLPAPTIEDGGDYFNTVTYAGNSSGASVTGVGFQPDFVWMKCRSTARNHELLDVVRGGSSTLFSNLTNAQSTDQRISSFNADGFTYTTNSNSANAGDTFVAWNWKANGSGVSNTAGSITSTVSVNTTSGFSIVTYTGNGSNGATVGHGLGIKPAMVIVKNRDSAVSWGVWHQSLTAETYFVSLNGTGAQSGPDDVFTAFSSTTFTLGVDNWSNENTKKYVAYCFAPVAGYSAFGSYTGNGSADGPFVYTGFRPAYVLRKRTDTSGASWRIIDTSRNTYNLADSILEPNTSDATETNNGIDVLSNGFKCRSTDTDGNASGGTYIFMAFAENPFSIALAR